MGNSEGINPPEWGEFKFGPVIGHLREAVDTIRNGSLEDRLEIKKELHAILTKGEIEELKDFVEQLEKDRATNE